MDGFIKVIYRPSASSEGLPFGLRSVGHAQLMKGESTEPLVLDFVQFLWSESGEGAALVDGEMRFLGPGKAACYKQGARHRLENRGEKAWECRWATLDGPLAASLAEGFGYGAEPFKAGPCPAEAFDRLESAIRNVGARGVGEASLLAYDLFVRAMPGAPAPHALQGLPEATAFEGKAMQAIVQSLSKPERGVSQVAEMLGMGRANFARRFKAATGSAPKDYIMTSRLQKALSLLSETDMSISEISRCCGFSTANYFAKFFRAKMGLAPSEFRTGKGRF